MTVETPPDCALGGDNMTNELIGELEDPQGRINHFGITPPLVWTWTVPNPVPSLPPLPARAMLDYEARIIVPSPPPPVPDSICPPTGDPVWDSDSVRKKTIAIFDSSGAVTKPGWEVKEFLFAVYKNPDGSYRTFEPAGQLQSTSCERPFVLPHPGFKDSTLVAIVHVHPFGQGQKIFCTNGDTGIYDNREHNGLSGGDGDLLSQHIMSIIERAGMSPRAIGVYIIDKDRDGTRLFLSDGSDSIRVLDPESFQTERVLKVRYSDSPLLHLNELEFFESRLLANIFESSWIAVINPTTGVVERMLDFADLYPERPVDAEVMNGIAVSPDGRHLLLTGKLWPKVFQVRILPVRP